MGGVLGVGAVSQDCEGSEFFPSWIRGEVLVARGFRPESWLPHVASPAVGTTCPVRRTRHSLC